MSFFHKLRLFFIPRTWGLHFVTGKPVTCDDGQVRDGFVMRRRDGDKVIYRALTDQEIESEIYSQAIK
jgi:hypothetical protein